MTRGPRIAIVGGGVGGLAAALALERRGAEIVVCEQSPALSDIGAGLHLSPNALMALRALGVEDAVIAIGSESDFLIIRSWKSGRIISRMSRGAFRQQFGAPSVTVHRADLLDVLRGALKTADIRLGARCIAVEGRDHGAVICCLILARARPWRSRTPACSQPRSRATQTISMRHCSPMSGYGCRVRGQPYWDRASEPAKIIWPRPGRGSNAT